MDDAMSRGADPQTVTWVSTQVLPHEAEVRRWLYNVYSDGNDVDDMVQEIYFKILRLKSTAHITDPRAYLFQAARNSLAGRLRRRRIVDIRSVQNLDELDISDIHPSPERVTIARAELKWVLCMIGNLPDRCRQVFRLRKIHGLSQAETAQRLSVTENVIEKETVRGVKLISEMAKRTGISTYSQTGTEGAPDTPDLNAPDHVRNRRHRH